MKLRARIFSIIMAVAMIMSSVVISASAATTDPTLTVTTDSATVTPGGEVVVTVNMANNSGIVSMRLELNYDNDVFTIASLDDVVDAGILGDAVHNNSAAKCPYILSWQNGTAEENFTVNGDLVSVTFQVADDAVAGERYEFSLSYDYDNTDIMNYGLAKVYFETVAATVTVEDAVQPEPDPDPDAPALKVVGTSGAAGEEVTVNIAVVNNPGFAGLNIDVDFDESALEYVSAKLLTDDLSITKNETTYKYVIYGSENVYDDIDVLSLTFKIKEDAEDGEYFVNATPYGKCADETETEIKFASINGAVVVVNFFPGDVNADGDVDTLDLIRLSRFVAEIEGTSIHGLASDVNADGNVDTLDLIRLARFVAEIEGTVLERSEADLPNNMVV